MLRYARVVRESNVGHVRSCSCHDRCLRIDMAAVVIGLCRQLSQHINNLNMVYNQPPCKEDVSRFVLCLGAVTHIPCPETKIYPYQMILIFNDDQSIIIQSLESFQRSTST